MGHVARTYRHGKARERDGRQEPRHPSYARACGLGRQVLFRPLTKLRVVTAVKNILDPAERTSIDKSGFPDTVVLVQISEADEMAAPSLATVATASTGKNEARPRRGRCGVQQHGRCSRD